MEYFVAVLLAVPGVILVLRSSGWAVDYVIWLVALNRFIRRLVDYYFNGEFNPLSLISLTPLLIGGCLFVCGLLRINSLEGNARRLFYCLFAALFLGFGIGVIHSPMGAVFSLGEWMTGIGTMLFVATLPTAFKSRNRWMKTAGWAAAVVAGYGWWQFYTIPPWDAMWLKQTGMIGYMGIPKPTQMTCFSTMNERGTAATFMAFGILPMLLNKQWRHPLSWPIMLLCVSTMVITYVRSSFIVLILVALLQPLLSRGRGTWQILLAALVFGAAAQYGMSRLPGMETFSERWSSKALTGKGSSFSGRLNIYGNGASYVLINPLGDGLGSSGMAARVNSKSAANVGDAGYLQIFAQFGWLGAVLFFSALWLLWRETSSRLAREKSSGLSPPDPFLPATRAILAGLLAFLFVTDVFSGFSLAWVFFGCALNPIANPEVRLAILRYLKLSPSQSPEGALPLPRPASSLT